MAKGILTDIHRMVADLGPNVPRLCPGLNGSMPLPDHKHNALHYSACGRDNRVRHCFSRRGSPNPRSSSSNPRRRSAIGALRNSRRSNPFPELKGKPPHKGAHGAGEGETLVLAAKRRYSSSAVGSAVLADPAVRLGNRAWDANFSKWTFKRRSIPVASIRGGFVCALQKFEEHGLWRLAARTTS